MLTQEDNDLLTRVGPKTPMGQLMREYWVPALLSSELPAADGPPMRVMLLSEKLIAMRDTDGRVALFAEACPHRGASLFYAQNKDCGLRCAFHGMKFDINGKCTDMPLEHNGEHLKNKIRAKVYPCRELGGVIWAYMGPREVPPPMPGIEVLSEKNLIVAATYAEGNWLQHLETDLDFLHLRHLHKGILDLAKKYTKGDLPRHIEWLEKTEAHRIEVVDSSVGCTFGVCEELTSEGDHCWGVGQFLMPFFGMLPQGPLGNHWITCRVPMDDYNTMTFGFIAGGHVASREQMFGEYDCQLPTDPDWFGRFRLKKNISNNFKIDRTLQNSTENVATGSGLTGQAVQDLAMACSLGPIADRSNEHLMPSDIMIARVRQKLLSAVRDYQTKNKIPPGVDDPEIYRVKHGSVILPRDRKWNEAIDNV